VRHPLSDFCLCLAILAIAYPARPAHAASRPDTARVHIGPADGGTDAYVAWPTGKGPGPAIIVVHEWWGMNGQIRDVARRLTAQGYVAIVPDLYHGKVADDPERAHVLLRSLEPAGVHADLEAAFEWLRAQPRVEKSRIGIIGFCAGGGFALDEALTNSELSAVVVFYGEVENDAARLAKLRAPLQAHFGEKDDGIPTSRVDAFRAALKKGGKVAEVYTYGGAGHAFMNESRPSYHLDAARLAWARALAFLQKHLKS
jgi:carboxymethylenebutenolidase